ARRALAPGGVLAIRVTNARFHSVLMRIRSALPWLGRLLPLTPVLHLWSFTPGGLRALVERAGLGVVACRDSPPVAESAGMVSSLRGLLAVGSAAMAGLSRGRCLVAPAIELYARRPRGARS